MTTSCTSCVALVAIAAGMLAGCGGSDPADPATTPASSPPPAQKHGLSVTLSGSGSVSSAPAGINCGTDCSESYDQGTSVTLSAAAASGQRFASWGGACGGSNSSCTLTMTTARDVTAQFVANTPPPDTQAPSVPANLAAQAAATQVNLSWNASTDNVGVQRYEVFRDDAAGPIGQPTATSYVDSAVSVGVTYVYRVRALDAAGNISGFSNPASATVTAPPPPPSGALKGWQLDATNTGLAPHGLNCDSLPLYVPAAYQLPAGTVISGKRIETDIGLSAGNIVIEKSCIRPRAPGFGFAKGDNVVAAAGPNGCSGASCASAQATVTIRDSEIDGSSFDDNTISHSCAFAGMANLQRNYMHDTGSGICFIDSGDYVSAVIEGNYVTRLRAFGDAGTDGSHNESMTVRDFDPRVHSQRTLIVRNNRFISKSGNDTAAFFIQPFAGHVDNVRIEGNALESFNYGLPLEFRPNGYGNNMRSVGNRFVRGGAGWPGAAYVDGGPGWAEWAENYFYDAAAPDGKGQPVPVPTP